MDSNNILIASFMHCYGFIQCIKQLASATLNISLDLATADQKKLVSYFFI